MIVIHVVKTGTCRTFRDVRISGEDGDKLRTSDWFFRVKGFFQSDIFEIGLGKTIIDGRFCPMVCIILSVLLICQRREQSLALVER